jgi:predicted alpha/beta superfamily hydrolase
MSVNTLIKSHIHVHQVYMPQLGRDRTVRVLLPRAYFRYPERPLAVMYMHDGQNLMEHRTAYHRGWGLREVMDRLPMKLQFIIVAIDNGHRHRVAEYVPAGVHRAAAEGEAYVAFIVEHLKPLIDRSYRTLPAREHTLTCGSSLGGLIAFYAATRYGHVFGKAGVLSPAFWMVPEVLEIPPGPRSKLYIVGSATESRGMTFTLQQTYWALKRAQWPDGQLRVVIKDRGRHNEAFWGRSFRQIAMWLMG